jgi:hypothetical protein
VFIEPRHCTAASPSKESKVLYVAGWIFFCVAAGMFAHIRRNRYGAEWFLVALVFSPLVAFVLLAILKEGPPRLRPIDTLSPEALQALRRRRDIQAIVSPLVGVALIIAFFAVTIFGVHHVIEQKKKDAAFDQQIQTELAHRNVAVGQ